MCEFCKNYGWLNPGRKDIFNNRKESENNEGVYTGMEAYLADGEKDCNKMIICSCEDTPYTKSTYTQSEFEINYCPMCGRNLKGRADMTETEFNLHKLIPEKDRQISALQISCKLLQKCLEEEREKNKELEEEIIAVLKNRGK